METLLVNVTGAVDMDNEMVRKTTVAKYGAQMGDIVMEIRRWITECGDPPDEAGIMSRTEEVFFGSELSEIAAIHEVAHIVRQIFERAACKYGILEKYLEDPEINEIMVNGPDMIFVERNRELEKVDDAYLSEDELEETIRMFASDVHREVNEANPIVDARLPSGYRINGVLKTVALNGPILTIRKFREKPIEMDELIESGSITRQCADDLKAFVRSGYNIFISGGTSTGKTTFLNALTAAINPAERVIIIEDSAELMITHLENKIHMECRSANSIGKGEVTMERLIRTSLRMRPDRIIVGEVRGREVVDMVQAMNTGHDGSMSTGHGNSIRGMLNRLETMYMTDSQMSVASVRNQIANAVDIFVHLRRDASGRRMVSEVAELTGTDGEEYNINYLYKSTSDGQLIPTGNSLIDTERLERELLRNDRSQDISVQQI